jgi:hypothetical protein
MINNEWELRKIIERASVILRPDEVDQLRGLINRVSELDDLVEAVCACRTQEIPMIMKRDLRDDQHGGNRP